MKSEKIKAVGLMLLAASFLSACSTPPVPVLSKREALKWAQVEYRPVSKDGAVRLALPLGNTGTGPQDHYHLFAQYHDGTPVIYGLGIETSTQRAGADTAVLVNGLGQLNPNELMETPLLLGRNRTYLEVVFSREFAEQSARAGRYFTLLGAQGSYEFPVPDWMFAALLEGLEKRLPELRKKSYNVPEVMTREQLRGNYVNEHPDRPYAVKEAVFYGEILAGMTPEDVRASWGEPEMVTQSQDDQGAYEIWRYPAARLMFEQGMVTVWQRE